MTVTPYTQPNFPVQGASAYKTNIDNSTAALAVLGTMFKPVAQGTPNMTIHVMFGRIWNGSTLTGVSAQNTGTITAPASNPRIDRVVTDQLSGLITVVTGTEAASPVAPAIPAGKNPCGRINLTVGMTEITNADIDDERAPASQASLLKVSSNDSTPDHLINKLASDTSVTITELNDGANEDAEIKVAAAGILRSHLKTTTVSLAGSVGATSGVNITLDAYSFFPMIHATGGTINVNGHPTDGASADAPRFRLDNPTGNPQTYDVDYRYIEAS